MTDFAPAFLDMFESLRMGPTFARGRRDERAGHVRSLTVSGSLAVALVRGPDDPVAFRSRIAVRSFGASEWARVEKTLAGAARFVAALLDGRMPPDIETVFAEAGLVLLPLSLDEVAMDCTCERWPMPCTHLAATCYALARAFESDPFEVFTWRGRPRDELLMRLRRLREASAVDEARVGKSGAGPSRRGQPGEVADDGSRGAGFGGRNADEADGAGEAGPGAPAPDGTAAAAGPAAFWGDPTVFWGDPTVFWGDAGTPGAARPGAGPAGRGEAAGPWSGSGENAGRREAAGPWSGSGESAGRRAASRTGPGPGSGPDEGAGRGPHRVESSEGGGWAWAFGAGDTTDGRERVARPDALLDQLDDPGLTHGGQPITEVLRVAYLALPDAPDVG